MFFYDFIHDEGHDEEVLKQVKTYVAFLSYYLNICHVWESKHYKGKLKDIELYKWIGGYMGGWFADAGKEVLVALTLSP